MQKINLEKLNFDLETLARKYPSSQWDIGASYNTEMNTQVSQGELSQVYGCQRTFATLRVWNNNGLIGFASTSDLSGNNLEQVFVGALEASKLSDPSCIPQFSPLTKSPTYKIQPPLRNSQSIVELANILRQTEIDLLAYHEAITSVISNGITQRTSECIYLNSEGALREQKYTAALLYLGVRSELLGRRSRVGEAYRQGHGVCDLKVQSCIMESAERSISHLNYEPIKTGYYTVCFSPNSFLALVMAFSNMFNARAVLDGTSLSTCNSLGTSIAVPFLSIVDEGPYSHRIGLSTFDGEGTPVQRVFLVEGGILCNFLHSEATARHFKISPTGHAGMGVKSSVNVDSLRISATPGFGRGDTSLNHEASDNFVWVDSLSAVQTGIKANQGSFSLPFDGWMIKGGEKRSIESAIITGNIKQVLSSILAVESTLVSTPQGTSPYIWVEDILIIGED
uniref:Possible modulator of DNA gyrase n=1 Tax=Paulinella chromatophora TaxID=39717 RepID=B1X5N4_PAUCH|nr:possible modulator of DNA gyrase [Paulinella chromatophora]ACB43253.1 possible modulator of DNA gyrase [Paulinella chromatophora]